VKIRDTKETLLVTNADLSGSSFTDVNLREAQFTDVNLSRAKFEDINLSEATFSRINLTNVEITDCNISGMKIKGILVSELLKSYKQHKHNRSETMKINAYLHFDGRCEAAFKFYEQCLGGKIVFKMTYGESPMAGQSPPGWRDKIMHARLIVKDQVLMGADAPPERYEAPKGFSMSLNLNDPAEAERIFSALVEKGTVVMPLQKTFWAERFGMLSDQFGIPWMINCEKEGGAAGK
jgi:PhnB protein